MLPSPFKIIKMFISCIGQISFLIKKPFTNTIKIPFIATQTKSSGIYSIAIFYFKKFITPLFSTQNTNKTTGPHLFSRLKTIFFNFFFIHDTTSNKHHCYAQKAQAPQPIQGRLVVLFVFIIILLLAILAVIFFAEKEAASSVRQQIIKILYIIVLCTQDLNIAGYLNESPCPFISSDREKVIEI